MLRSQLQLKFVFARRRLSDLRTALFYSVLLRSFCRGGGGFHLGNKTFLSCWARWTSQRFSMGNSSQSSLAWAPSAKPYRNPCKLVWRSAESRGAGVPSELHSE